MGDFIWVVAVCLLAVVAAAINVFAFSLPAQSAAEARCTQAGGVYVRSASTKNICVRGQIINIEQTPTKG